MKRSDIEELIRKEQRELDGLVEHRRKLKESIAGYEKLLELVEEGKLELDVD